MYFNLILYYATRSVLRYSVVKHCVVIIIVATTSTDHCSATNTRYFSSEIYFSYSLDSWSYTGSLEMQHALTLIRFRCNLWVGVAGMKMYLRSENLASVYRIYFHVNVDMRMLRVLHSTKNRATKRNHYF